MPKPVVSRRYFQPIFSAVCHTPAWITDLDGPQRPLRHGFEPTRSFPEYEDDSDTDAPASLHEIVALCHVIFTGHLTFSHSFEPSPVNL